MKWTKDLCVHCGVSHNILPLLKSFPSANPFLIHKVIQNSLCFCVLLKEPHNWTHNKTQLWENYFHFSVDLCLGEVSPREFWKTAQMWNRSLHLIKNLEFLYKLFLTNVWQMNIYMWQLRRVMKGKQLC